MTSSLSISRTSAYSPFLHHIQFDFSTFMLSVPCPSTLHPALHKAGSFLSIRSRSKHCLHIESSPDYSTYTTITQLGLLVSQLLPHSGTVLLMYALLGCYPPLLSLDSKVHEYWDFWFSTAVPLVP